MQTLNPYLCRNNTMMAETALLTNGQHAAAMLSSFYAAVAGRHINGAALKAGMMRWKRLPLYPDPGSATHSALKFSAVLGTQSTFSSIVTRPCALCVFQEATFILIEYLMVNYHR